MNTRYAARIYTRTRGPQLRGRGGRHLPLGPSLLGFFPSQKPQPLPRYLLTLLILS